MFTKIAVEDLKGNVFEEFAKKWALLAVGDEEKNNSMTISWGMMGVLWNKNVIQVFVRPTRYTFEMLENSSSFSVNFFLEEQKDILRFCGNKSGRTVNKAKALNLTPTMLDGTLTYEEANLIFIVNKLYQEPFHDENFLDESIFQHYSKTLEDYHHCFIGEIIGVYQK